MQPGMPESYHRPAPNNNISPPAPPQNVHLDRVVSSPTPKRNVEGQLVTADYTPRAGAEIVFVLAERSNVEKRVNTDKDGEFNTSLTEGQWDVYVKERGGPAVLQKRIEVGPKGQIVTLLSK
jgi:hypothetical protein